MTTESAAIGASSELSPHEPPLLELELPRICAEIGPAPEDFVVDEIPLYAFSGAGEHCYVRLEKRNFTTPAMVRVVTRAAGIDERDVGYAGLKDKHAVTRQWLSLPAKARPPNEWQLPEGIRVLEHTRHANKLRTGHLLGNRFRITLDVTDNVGALDGANAIAEVLRARGLYNYFGGQRFGRRGDGLRQALDWLREGARVHGVPRFLAKLYPSVIQAEVFNRYLSARRALGGDRLIPGEIVRLDKAGAMFMVEDTARETPRLARADIHLTGPIFGPKTRAAGAEAAELERSIIEQLGLDAAALEKLGRLAPGTRRDLLAPIEDLRLEWAAVGRLAVEFSLPSGSYATELIRQFTAASFLIDEPDRGDGG
ncbi:MAG TPA: tRNA pseudouridine(13) synthase TruD [Polyangiaceae bacterium]|nr:tRNA pseudouridine(13) synthase TruD [Polyangiaceae bacterium]